MWRCCYTRDAKPPVALGQPKRWGDEMWWIKMRPAEVKRNWICFGAVKWNIQFVRCLVKVIQKNKVSSFNHFHWSSHSPSSRCRKMGTSSGWTTMFGLTEHPPLISYWISTVKDSLATWHLLEISFLYQNQKTANISKRKRRPMYAPFEQFLWNQHTLLQR